MSHAQAHQSRQDHQQRDELAADVLLFKAEDAVDERDDEAHTIKDKRDEHHYGSVLLQAGEIDDVGHGDKNRHGHDAPTPLERLFLSFGQPDEKKQQRHHEEIVNSVPCLDGGW